MRARNPYPSPFWHILAFSMACRSLDGDFTDSDPRVPCFYRPVTRAKGRLAHIKRRDLRAPSVQGKNSDVFESQTWAVGWCAGQNQHLAAGDPPGLTPAVQCWWEQAGVTRGDALCCEELQEEPLGAPRSPSEPLGVTQALSVAEYWDLSGLQHRLKFVWSPCCYCTGQFPIC